MQDWFTADLHFRHKNIFEKSYSDRPYFSVDQMDQDLILQWNKVIAPLDRVYIVGDFCFGRIETIINVARQLHGEKHIILGNHDKKIRKNKRQLLEMGVFASISRGKEIVIGNQYIVLSHYAHRVWERSHRGSWMLHGHSHGTLPPHGKSVDVGIDAKFITEEYRPVSFHEVKEFMMRREVEYVDHHR